MGPKPCQRVPLNLWHLHLLDRVVIVGDVLTLIPGSRRSSFKSFQALGLLQDVGASEIITALPGICTIACADM